VFHTEILRIRVGQYDVNQAVVELREGPRGPGPSERPGGPLETPGLRGYKGPLKGPPEITSQIQYMIATYQCHSKHRWCCTVPGYT